MMTASLYIRIASLLAAVVLSFTTAQAQIYVLSARTGTVGEYNRDGTVVNAALIQDSTGAKSLAVAGSNLVVADQVKEAILQYSVSGQPLTPAAIASAKPWAVAVSGSKVFVASPQTGTVGEYTLDGKTINAALIKGLKGPSVIGVSGSNILSARTMVPSASTPWTARR